jgi:hypothetical protein
VNGRVDQITVFFANFTNVTFGADTRVPVPRAEATVAASSTAFQEEVLVRYEAAVSADVATGARAEFQRRWALLAAGYPTDALGRLGARTCAEVKAAVFNTQIAIINAVVEGLIASSFQSYKDFRAALANHAASLAAQIDANAEPIKIAEANLVVQIDIATQRAVELEFFIAIREQKLREAIVKFVNASLEYFRAVDAQATAAVLTEKKAIAEEAFVAWATAHIIYNRSIRWRELFRAEAEALRARINKAIEDLRNAIRQAWADVVTAVAAWFQKTQEEIRARVAAALEAIRCDTAAATVTFNKNDGEATFTASYAGIVCYDTSRSADELRAFACGALRAQFVTEIGTTDATAYGCVAVASKKRDALQTGETMDVTINGAAPPEPAPGPQSSGVSITACFLLLLLSVLLHF